MDQCWTCTTCTFAGNSLSNEFCATCNAARPAGLGNFWACEACTCENPLATSKCSACDTPRGGRPPDLPQPRELTARTQPCLNTDCTFFGTEKRAGFCTTCYKNLTQDMRKFYQDKKNSQRQLLADMQDSFMEKVSVGPPLPRGQPKMIMRVPAPAPMPVPAPVPVMMAPPVLVPQRYDLHLHVLTVKECGVAPPDVVVSCVLGPRLDAYNVMQTPQTVRFNSRPTAADASGVIQVNQNFVVPNIDPSFMLVAEVLALGGTLCMGRVVINVQYMIASLQAVGTIPKLMKAALGPRPGQLLPPGVTGGKLLLMVQLAPAGTLQPR
eukprot:gnl/Spiro4/15606_TR8392_c0_g1_i1.p1 gnl/Spiro4/15606_TR8392_c0_g1~~gnl/Spiro4/15606_TR8392_c0_g1_i1.p1  ORF type:complete len:324 (+),score=46.35 gnl/Spiro4/15606_TR8392_c0_g1_i1:97-1068(+)